MESDFQSLEQDIPAALLPESLLMIRGGGPGKQGDFYDIIANNKAALQRRSLQLCLSNSIALWIDFVIAVSLRISFR